MDPQSVNSILERYKDSDSDIPPDIKNAIEKQRKLSQTENHAYLLRQEQRKRIDDIIANIIIHHAEIEKQQKVIDSEIQRIHEIKKRATLISMNRASSPNARKDFMRLLTINEKIFLLMELYWVTIKLPEPFSWRLKADRQELEKLLWKKWFEPNPQSVKYTFDQLDQAEKTRIKELLSVFKIIP